jgi:hypothetical protein
MAKLKSPRAVAVWLAKMMVCQLPSEARMDVWLVTKLGVNEVEVPQAFKNGGVWLVLARRAARKKHVRSSCCRRLSCDHVTTDVGTQFQVSGWAFSHGARLGCQAQSHRSIGHS